jgi:prepilin-type N-terminal cleavage/methylation domain-containing protein
MKSFSKGFTLIELLVVIAIIGLLSSVVLASLSTARGKGNDSAIKSQLSSIRAQAEIYRISNGSFNFSAPAAATTPVICGSQASTMFSDQKINDLIVAANTASGAGIVNSCMATQGASGVWAVAVTYKTDKTKAWCVDSSGNSKEMSTQTANNYTQITLDADMDLGVCEN